MVVWRSWANSLPLASAWGPKFSIGSLKYEYYKLIKTSLFLISVQDLETAAVMTSSIQIGGNDTLDSDVPTDQKLSTILPLCVPHTTANHPISSLLHVVCSTTFTKDCPDPRNNPSFSSSAKLW